MQLLKKNQAEPTLKTHKEIESQLFRSASMKKKSVSTAARRQMSFELSPQILKKHCGRR
jgi:hypothetical protein